VPSGLVGWWRAEGNGLDSAGTNNGAVLGSTTFATGEVGQAFHFNGTSNSYVQVPDSPAYVFSNNRMTLELWAYRTGLETSMQMVSKRNTNGSAYFVMGFTPGTGLAFSTDGNAFAFTSVQMPLNTWMHLAATCDGSLTTFYTNGVQCGVPGPGNFWGSQQCSSNNWNGWPRAFQRTDR